ncbi:MAG: hypothetical protein QI223_02265, partial [Candidatus Korarchaeota archaeon]|nr:hypothetical protein [Candidatus Korarchaeota archaeon]
MQGLDDIRETVEEVRADHPKLKAHEAFVAWFCEAYLVGERAKAIECLTGAPGDMGIDAVYVDHRFGQVHLVQGKYHTSPGTQENAAVRQFAELAADFADPDAEEHWEKASAPARKKIVAAHKAFHSREYYLAMYFVTTGTVKRDVAEDARKVALKAADSFEVLDHNALAQIHRDWLEAVAPPLPELEMAAVEKTPLQHGGDSAPLAWVFTTTAAELARLYDLAGDR